MESAVVITARKHIFLDVPQKILLVIFQELLYKRQDVTATSKANKYAVQQGTTLTVDLSMTNCYLHILLKMVK